MNIELSGKQFRRLLDLVYIGNWVLNSVRGDDRFADYDEVESKLFSYCQGGKLQSLVGLEDGQAVPSKAFVEGGIHDAIINYEDTIFFEILAEELARRDMEYQPISSDNFDELLGRIDEYISEFEANGTDNISLDI